MTRDNDTTGILKARDEAPRLPTDTMPKRDMRAKNVYQLTKSEPLPDGNSSQNPATFCRTWNDEQGMQMTDENITCIVPTFGVTCTRTYEFRAQECKPLVKNMKRIMDFLVRHSPAHHLKESEATAFKHT